MPQVEIQTFLDLCEGAGKLAFWDLETSGLGADYQSILLCTIKPFGKEPYTTQSDQFNKDKALVRWAKAELEKYFILVAHNGKQFDIPYLNARLLYWGRQNLKPLYHLDTYQSLRYKLRLASKSQAHLLKFLNLPQKKMDLPPETWQNFHLNREDRRSLIERNVTDCVGLEQIYRRTRHLIRDLKLC